MEAGTKYLFITIEKDKHLVHWRTENGRTGTDPISDYGCLSSALGDIIRCGLPGGDKILTVDIRQD